MPSCAFCRASPGVQLLGIAEARYGLGVPAAERPSASPMDGAVGAAAGRAHERWLLYAVRPGDMVHFSKDHLVLTLAILA